MMIAIDIDTSGFWPFGSLDTLAKQPYGNVGSLAILHLWLLQELLIMSHFGLSSKRR
jgi:hypothetical protein